MPFAQAHFVLITSHCCLIYGIFHHRIPVWNIRKDGPRKEREAMVYSFVEQKVRGDEWSIVLRNKVLKCFNWLLNMRVRPLLHMLVFFSWLTGSGTFLCGSAVVDTLPWSDNKTCTCKKRKLSMEGEKHSGETSYITLYDIYLCKFWLSLVHIVIFFMVLVFLQFTSTVWLKLLHQNHAKCNHIAYHIHKLVLICILSHSKVWGR